MFPVSIVIPNWNGAHLLRANLPSILEAANKFEFGAEIVVVDDGSTDDSVQVLESEFPAVRVVALPENRGFGAACWSGVTSTQHPIVILLNSDVQVELNFIAPLVETFERDGTFAAMPLIFTSGPRKIEKCVTFTLPYLKHGKFRYLRGRSLALLKPEAADLGWYTLYPSGAAVAFHRQRFVELGGFDPLYAPFYYEDFDFGFRAWRRGWTCQVVPKSHVYHQDSQTIGKNFSRKRVLLLRKRNRILLHAKNLTSKRLLSYFLFGQVVRAVSGLFRLRFIDFAATLLAIPRLPMALRKRRMELHARVRSEREICALLLARYEEARERLERAGTTGEVVLVPHAANGTAHCSAETHPANSDSAVLDSHEHHPQQQATESPASK